MENWNPNVVNFVVVDANGKIIEPCLASKALSYADWLASPTLREPYIPSSDDLRRLYDIIRIGGVLPIYKDAFDEALRSESMSRIGIDEAFRPDPMTTLIGLRNLWNKNWRPINEKNIIRKHPYMK